MNCALTTLLEHLYCQTDCKLSLHFKKNLCFILRHSACLVLMPCPAWRPFHCCQLCFVACEYTLHPYLHENITHQIAGPKIEQHKKSTWHFHMTLYFSRHTKAPLLAHTPSKLPPFGVTGFIQTVMKAGYFFTFLTYTSSQLYLE